MNLRRVLVAVVLCALALLSVLTLSSHWGIQRLANAAGGPPTPTPTTGATPTPKPSGAGGALTGVSDIVLDGNAGTPVPGTDLVHCISYTQDRGDTTIKAALACYSNNVALADPNGEPLIDAPGEGQSGDAGGVGPPPPPPYGPAAPAKGSGTLIADNLQVATCFPEVGGPNGPNIISVLKVTGAVAQLGLNGYQNATVDIYYNQPDAACDAAANAGTVPGGSPTFPAIGTTRYSATDNANCPLSNCLQSPFRGSPSAGGDFDGDGCSDAAELDKLDSTNCGDDPWNPNDTNLTSTDVAGDYSFIATATDEDCTPTLTGSATVCEAADRNLPGFYYSCIAAIEQNGKAVKAWANCYTDSPTVVINPQAVGSPNTNATSCPPAPADYCGDGSPGSPPPGITVTGGSVRNFADIDTKSNVLTGTVDNTKNALLLNGCFEDVDGHSPLGNVYVRSLTDLNTGHGFWEVYSAQTTVNCTSGTPAGAPNDAQLDIVRQRKAATKRDSDSDGCPDRAELGDPGNTTNANLTQSKGGLRDPSNHYDYFDPTHDHMIRADDILAVVDQYFHDDADSTPGFPPYVSGYNPDTDRAALAGGNTWNLGPPNGQQRVNDILAVVLQYRHDC